MFVCVYVFFFGGGDGSARKPKLDIVIEDEPGPVDPDAIVEVQLQETDTFTLFYLPAKCVQTDGPLAASVTERNTNYTEVRPGVAERRRCRCAAADGGGDARSLNVCVCVCVDGMLRGACAAEEEEGRQRYVRATGNADLQRAIQEQGHTGTRMNQPTFIHPCQRWAFIILINGGCMDGACCA